MAVKLNITTAALHSSAELRDIYYQLYTNLSPFSRVDITDDGSKFLLYIYKKQFDRTEGLETQDLEYDENDDVYAHILLYKSDRNYHRTKQIVFKLTNEVKNAMEIINNESELTSVESSNIYRIKRTLESLHVRSL